jgi:murein DD-endopeptidase MepM/ murein hydrolase activator NlpD
MRLLTIVAAFTLLAAVASSATSAVARGWIRPVDGPVLRGFAVGPDRFAAGQHRGVDLAVAPGSPVLAACGGRVTFAGRVPGGGRTVSVRCGALVATYQHLGSVGVGRGKVVMPGGPIGRSGAALPQPHVHLGARVAATGEYRDPLALLSGAPRGPLAPVPAPRRAPPVDLAPRSRPQPLWPGPAPAPGFAPLRLPAAHPFAPAPGARAAARLPWAVWAGLALVALGVPLGGGLVVARRRRRATVAAGRHAPA